MITKLQKEYKELLNKTYAVDKTGKGKNNRYKPNTRLYGDYLWARDKEMFLAGFEQWRRTGIV
jgi:hypothetical protein